MGKKSILEKGGKTIIYIPRYIIDQEATKWYLLDKLCLPPVQFIMVARNEFVGGQSSKFYQTSQTVMILSISTAEHWKGSKNFYFSYLVLCNT